jgi:glyoxylase-like metal-dependent hydrolase (beta-lactamase superfamily II)
MATHPLDITSEMFHMFSLGSLPCISLSDGYIPSTTKLTAPEISEEELSEFLIERGEHPTDKRTPISCLLVDLPDAGRTIVDAGIGALPGPGGKPFASAGKLRASLQAANIEPSTVINVLVSHIHPDHIGGLFDHNDVALFPNATYFVPQGEVDFWGHRSPDLSGSLLPPPMKIEVVAAAKRFLDLAKLQMKIFRAGEEPLRGVKTILLDGHTPGQVGFLFESDGEAMLYSADAAGHHLISLERPHWRFSYDSDAPRAIETRRSLVEKLIETGWYNFTPHFPWPSFGQITRKDGLPVWTKGLRSESS